MPGTGFILGDHQFYGPNDGAPPHAIGTKTKRITGAPPPTCLDGLVVESLGKTNPAKKLVKGKFCGHGEPTFTVFDVVIDGVDELEFGAIEYSPEEEASQVIDEEAGPWVLAVRIPGASGPWHVIFRREWEERSETLSHILRTELSRDEEARLLPEIMVGRASVGLEYPADANSRDEATWMTIVADLNGLPKGAHIVDAELA